MGWPASSAAPWPKRRSICEFTITMRPAALMTSMPSGAVSNSARKLGGASRPAKRLGSLIARSSWRRHGSREHVARAAHRLDERGALGIFFDLAAQASHLYVDG